MATGNAAGWRAALGEIDRAIGDCLSALDRYEATFANLFREGAVDRPPRPVVDPNAGGGLRGWDEKLGAAREATDAVERLLAEQEAVWGQWREAMADWQRLAATSPVPSANQDSEG